MKAHRQAATLALGLIALLLPISRSAMAQSVSLSRNTLDFGTNAVGKSSSALNVILTNSDKSVPLYIATIVASGDYSETDDCSGVVAPLGSCTLLITFRPNTGGTVTGVVTLNDDALNSPQLVTVTGAGIVPLAVTPASLTFGTVAVGSTSAGKTVTVTNDLSKTVNIGFSASGDYTAAGSGATPCATSLASKGSCTIVVKFTPTVAGAIDGSLVVTQNINSNPGIVTFSGTGSGGSTPPLSFSPSSLSFGSLGAGGINTKTVTVTNKSSKTVTISAFLASGSYSAVGGEASPCGGALTAGNQCTIAVSFQPLTMGTINGALTITENTSVKTQILELSGTGTVSLKVSPASLTFATQQQGALSTPQTVTVTNHLKSAVNFSAITVSGDYSISNTCGSSLAAGSTCTIDVTFSPIARKGSISGALTIASDAVSSPFVVPLTGSAEGSLPRFAYVANITDNTVSMYTVDVRTGKLRPNGYVLAGTEPTSVAVDPAGKFAYVANYDDSTISAYKIDPHQGTLTPIVGSPFTSGQQPPSVTVHPSGKFAYATSIADNQVWAYAISSSSGALTVVSGSPFATGNYPEDVTLDPSGKFAYVINALDNTVSAYTIATSGGLTPVLGSPFPTGAGPYKLAIDPAGKFAYVSNGGGNSISAYTITSAGGLSPIADVPYGSGTFPFALTVDQLGKFLFVENVGSSNISVYSIAATGALTQISGSPFPTVHAPGGIAVDASNQFLYVTDQNGDAVDTYMISPSSGALTLLETVAARYEPFSIAMTKGSTPVTYTPSFAYVSDTGSGSIPAFTIDPVTGSLTAISGSPFPGAEAYLIAVDPQGRFVYLCDLSTSTDVLEYTIDPSTGSLTAITGSPFATGKKLGAIAVDPSGRFAYVANEVDNTVSGYVIAATGALQAIPGALATDFSPNSIAIDPSGRFVYVGNEASGGATVSAFTINPMTGALTVVSGSPYKVGGSDNTPVTVDPWGHFLYITTYSSNVISVYAINSTSGALTMVPGSSSAGLSGPTSMALDPLGRFAFVVNHNSPTICVYTISPSNGTLTPVPGSPFAVTAYPEVAAVDSSGRFLYVTSEDPVTPSSLVSVYDVDPSTGALEEISGSPFPAGKTVYGVITTGKVH